MATNTNTTMTDDYAANVNAAKVDILGHIVWSHVRDSRIPRGDLATIVNDCGVDPKYLPKVPALSDVFRRATSESSGVKDGPFTFLVRKVSDKGGHIIRHIIKEERDEHGKRLGYTKVGELEFKDGSMTAAIADGEPKAEQIVNDAAERFRVYATNVTGEEVHRMVKKMLDDMSRVSVHPTGGVYFVPMFYGSDLRGIQCMVRKLDAYATGEGRADRNIFSIVPLPNIEEHRDEIAGAFNSAFNGEVEAAIADMAETLRGLGNSKPAENLVAAKAGHLAALQSKLADYRKVMGDTINAAAFRLDLLAEQVDDLADAGSMTFEESEFAKAVVGIPGLAFTAKASYTAVEFNGHLLGRVRFSRTGINMYSGIDLGNHPAAARKEWEDAGKNGHKVATDDPEIFELFIKAMTTKATTAPKARTRKTRRASGAKAVTRKNG